MTKKKPKSNPASPSNLPTGSLTHLNDHLKSPLAHQSTKTGPQANTTTSNAPNAPPGPSAHPPPPLPAPKFVSDAWVMERVKTIPADLRICLDHDFDQRWSEFTRLQFYRLLFHFDEKTSSRPTQRKDLLTNAFTKDIRPLILPFISPPPPPAPVAMQTDADDEMDFDPRGQKITRAMLAEVITKKKPTFDISSAGRTEQLLWLYKAVVDPQLPLAKNTEFSYIPRVIKGPRLQQLSIEEL